MEAHLYTRLSELTGLSISKLERSLKLANGAMKKAIERGSAVKPETLDKIVKEYPEESERLGYSTAFVYDKGNGLKEIGLAQTKPSEPANDDYREKYIRSLENQLETQKQLIITANAATKAANASTELVNMVLTDYVSVKTFEDANAIHEGFQEFVLASLSKLENRSVQAVRAEMGIVVGETLKRKDKLSAAHK